MARTMSHCDGRVTVDLIETDHPTGTPTVVYLRISENDRAGLELELNLTEANELWEALGFKLAEAMAQRKFPGED